MSNEGAPEYQSIGFRCPHCDHFAQMTWKHVQQPEGNPKATPDANYHFARCHRCGRPNIWRQWHEQQPAQAANAEIRARMIYPVISEAPLPHPSLDDDLREDYQEAAAILADSPRGASALLRVVMEKLCRMLAGPRAKASDKMDTVIGKLAADGLPDRVQKAMDVVRVIGNDAVHAGVLSEKDDPETAMRLFWLVNKVVEHQIAEPAEIDELFDSLPDGKRQGIADRNRRLGGSQE